MTIDRILHEKHMGLVWQPFVCKPKRPNQLHYTQLAIDSTTNQCIDGQFKYISHDISFCISKTKLKNKMIDLLVVDLNESESIQKQIDDVNVQQSNFSDLFYTIAEQIATQQDWMLGDGFTEILELINDEEQKRIVTIDNIFSVSVNFHRLIFFTYTSHCFK